MAIRVTLVGVRRSRAQGRTVQRAIGRALHDGVKTTTDRTKRFIRGKVNEAFQGSRRNKRGNSRVANAVRSKMFANDFIRPRGLIWSGFVKRRQGRNIDIIAAGLFGAVIRPQRGRMLLIPLGRGVQRNLSYFENRGIKLRSVPIRGGRAVLLVRETRTRSTPLFLLVRQVRLRRHTTPRQIRAVASRALARDIDAAWRRQSLRLPGAG